jgi:hypothetical protein
MSDNDNQKKTAQYYKTAHDAHYKTKDLRKALDLYTSVVDAYPDTREAEYSRTQIQNIAKNLVPKRELLDAERALIYSHLDQEEKPPIIEQVPSSPLPALEPLV